MKTKRTTKQQESEPTAQTVRVEFIHETASQVCIAGAFNDWRPEVTPMISLGDGRWIKNWHYRRAAMNTGWWWTARGCLIHAPAKPCPTRLAE